MRFINAMAYSLDLPRVIITDHFADFCVLMLQANLIDRQGSVCAIS
jgi:hypothetical protein